MININDALNPTPDKTHVLVVTLTGKTNYLKIDPAVAITTDDDIWVTASPQLQDLCQSPDFANPTHGDLNMRLRQILGLTPTARVINFVEFRVKPSDIFRPAPDNEITDTTAGLCLPESTTVDYREWFNTLRSHQYYQCNAPYSQEPTSNNAYPWTQLGYTYDWGNNDFPHQGLSEFVIRKGSEVYINSVVSTEAYCSP